ncbi:phasin family protein [Lichenibacterium minor]|uniref:Phasin family protein n=1 Tax=Lichenibacterium minor TaxID=2316528 RepID=A0A4Q2U1A9_9HYPH|nr:phasin family protein [Lichenibacterium minor]RYC30233.1 phasin family protein [Lichenibacterium minor]
MPSDTAQAEEHRDPRDGTAVIPPVTAAMLDHAAHEAAALADGVAHHTIALDHATPAPAPEVVPSSPEVAADVATRAVGAGSDVAADAAREAAEVAVTVAGDLSDAAVRFARDAAAPVQRAAEAAPDAAPVPTDALSRYNAKVFEMVRANAASTTAHLAALVQARSVPDALSLNAEHMRRQVEVLASQGQELAALAGRIALDALRPFKGPTEG